MTSSNTSFVSGARRGRVAVVAFIVMAFLSAVDALGSFWHVNLINRIESDGVWTDQEVLISDTIVGIVVILRIASFIVVIIGFLMWFHRVRANLPSLGIMDARWSPGWAVGWWFVPLMNLFRPYQVAVEIWRASDPSASPSDWRSRPKAAVLDWWWAFFLIGGFIDRVSGRLWLRIDETPRRFDLDLIPIVDSASAVVIVGGTILIVRIIREIDRRQSQRAAVIAF